MFEIDGEGGGDAAESQLKRMRSANLRHRRYVSTYQDGSGCSGEETHVAYYKDGRRMVKESAVVSKAVCGCCLNMKEMSSKERLLSMND